MKAITITALGLAATLGAREASAWPGLKNWSIQGSGCVVSSDTSSLAITDAYNFNVAFAGTNTGTIHITCPVTGLMPTLGGNTSPIDLYTSFVDTDGTADNCTINTYLYRYSVNSLSVMEIAHYNGATDTTMAGSPFFNYELVNFSHTFDFDSYYYTVYVDLFRNSTSCNVKFFGAQLGDYSP